MAAAAHGVWRLGARVGAGELLLAERRRWNAEAECCAVLCYCELPSLGMQILNRHQPPPSTHHHQNAQMAGSQDVCGAVDHAEVVSAEALAAARPSVVVWALCGLDLDQSARAARAAMRRLGAAWQGLPAAQAGRVAVVDGEHVFSRPGPLLGQSLEVLVEILHPEAQPFGHQGKLWRWLPAAPA